MATNTTHVPVNMERVWAIAEKLRAIYEEHMAGIAPPSLIIPIRPVPGAEDEKRGRFSEFGVALSLVTHIQLANFSNEAASNIFDVWSKAAAEIAAEFFSSNQPPPRKGA